MFNIFDRAQKTDDPQQQQVRALPAGLIENDGQVVSASEDLVSLACDGWSIKQRIDALQKELKTITTKLENSLGAGSTLAVDNVCRVTLSARQTFSLTDPDKCEAILGGRFSDLVDSSIEYTLTNKLKDIMLDPDHPLSAQLRACIAIKEGITVTFRPGKPL